MTNFRNLERLIAAGAATEADFASVAPAEVRRIKSELPYQARGVLVARAMPGEPGDGEDPMLPADPNDRVIRHIANVQLVDRMGDLILSNPADAAKYDGEGWITRHWRAAGAPFLWQHRSDEPAIGVCLPESIEEIAVPALDAPGGKAWALVIPVRYLADEAIPLSVPAYLLAKAGITGTSVGFLARKVVYIEDDKERGEIGLGRWGALLVTCELLELSKAQIPANPWSIATGKAAGEQERRVLRALDGFVAKGVLPASLRADFVARVPLGDTDAAARLEARVRSFVPQAKAVRGRPCVGLECLTEQRFATGRLVAGAVDFDLVHDIHTEMHTPALGVMAGIPVRMTVRTPAAEDFTVSGTAIADAVRRAAKPDCGCGKAKGVPGLEGTPLDPKAPHTREQLHTLLLRAEEAHASARAQLAMVSDLLGVRDGGDVVGALTEHLAKADADVPPRSMQHVRGAVEDLSRALERLVFVVDDDGADAAPEKSSGILSQMADVPVSALSTELRAALVDPDSLAVLDLMARRMARTTTSRGGSRHPAPAGPAIEPSAGGDATRGRNAQAARDPAMDEALRGFTSAVAGLGAPTTT